MVPANQGSRGALVAWTVVTTILFVASTIFAIYFYVEANKVGDVARTTADKFKKVVTEPQLGAPELNDLEAVKANEELGFNASMSLLDVALKQRDDLANAIGPSKYEQAMAAVNKLKTENLQRVSVEGGAKLDASNIEGLVNSMTDALASSQGEVAKLREDLASAQKAQENAAKELATARAAMDKQLADVRASAEQAMSDKDTYTQTKDQQLNEIQTNYQQELVNAQTAAAQAATQIIDFQRALDQKQKEIQDIQVKLTALRVNASDPTVRQADGRIVRIPSANVVYIDIGQGDQVSPGMTFQVFDKVEGVPPPGDADSDDDLPRGKASIEVVQVGPTSSEARVVRLQPGQTITQGDLIVNLVYDRNTRYNFMVFGNFDTDRNGIATPSETEVIKRLVTQWGGRLTDKVNVDTDFVVLGAEPVLPEFTQEELQDSINLAIYERARREGDAYQQVRSIAQDYNVPILNQNRFLYFVGFYELAKR